VRTTDSRDKTGQAEKMCFLSGGYDMLIKALAQAITARGGDIRLNTAVQQVRVEDGRVTGLRLADTELDSDGVIITMQTPIARRLLPPEAATVNERWSALNDYLGIVCMLMILKRSLTPYYTLNISDETIPFTGVIETTNLIDRQYTNGYHLIYLPKYAKPDNTFAQMDDDTLTKSFMIFLRDMFPSFSERDVAAIRIGRERYVEPLHPVGRTDDIPPITSDVPGLYLINSSQIYPQLTNGEAAVTYAQRAAGVVVGAQASIRTADASLIAS
jgi:protoporphyrinogen oxidase